MKTKKEIYEISNILKEEYKDAKCGLDYTTAFELLIATILSAQCTDERVNIVTKKLFKEANTPSGILNLGREKLLSHIKTCGLSNTKTDNILKTCQRLLSVYSGQVPKTMEDLTSLYGVGRKTANVVMSNAYNIPAIAVDTHVKRLSNRIGLVDTDDVLKIENKLMEIIEKDYWSDFHHHIIWHGRKVCSAKKPQCERCFLSMYCDYPKK